MRWFLCIGCWVVLSVHPVYASEQADLEIEPGSLIVVAVSQPNSHHTVRVTFSGTSADLVTTCDLFDYVETIGPLAYQLVMKTRIQQRPCAARTSDTTIVFDLVLPQKAIFVLNERSYQFDYELYLNDGPFFTSLLPTSKY